MNQAKFLQNKNLTVIDEHLVKSLVETTIKVIEEYSHSTATYAKCRASKNLSVVHQIGGFLNFSINESPVQFSFSIDKEFAKDLFEKMTGLKPEKADENVIECVKELTNILYGAFKAPLSSAEYKFSSTLPKSTDNINLELKDKNSLEVQFNVENKISQFSITLSI